MNGLVYHLVYRKNGRTSGFRETEMVSLVLLTTALLVACKLQISKFSGASASTVEWTAVPSGISLPSAQDSSLSASKLVLLNEYLLGLTANAPSGFDASGDLFSRPRALAVITVDSVDSLPQQTKNSYQFYNVSIDTPRSFFRTVQHRTWWTAN